MRNLVWVLAVSMAGCELNDPETTLDDEYGVDENGLLTYSPIGEFEQEPIANLQTFLPIEEPELSAAELAALPDAHEVLMQEGLIDPNLGLEPYVAEPGDDVVSTSQELVNCRKHNDTGYRSGRAFRVTLVSADYKPAGINAANAFAAMEKAAARAGVSLVVNSGFRTMAQQRYLYNCYLTQRCNGGALAARPGYSNHQSGIAMDISTRAASVYRWLRANAHRFGFVRTVPSEPWHWEYRGGTRSSPCAH